MTSVLVQFKVQEYSKWRAVYEENVETREAQGMGAAKIFRDSNNPNSIALLLEVTDLEKARAYADSDVLKQSQIKGGVLPPPTVTWLDEA